MVAARAVTAIPLVGTALAVEDRRSGLLLPGQDSLVLTLELSEQWNVPTAREAQRP